MSVQNINEARFYVKKEKANDEADISTNCTVTKANKITIGKNEKAYYFIKGALSKRVDGDIKIQKGDYVVIFNDRINRQRLENSLRILNINSLVISAIRYGTSYIAFNKEDYDKVFLKTNDDLIKDYLDMCLEDGSIKKDVIEILMEDNNETC